MNATEACECLYNGIPVTIKSLTNAQSYCIKDVYPYEQGVVAKLASCHIDYCDKAVDIDNRHTVMANVNELNEICIEDYDNYQVVLR